VSRRKIADVLPSLVLAAVAAAYVWVSYDYDAPSRGMPWIAGILAIALALLDVASRLQSDAARKLGGLWPGRGAGQSGDTESEAQAPHPPFRETLAFGWIAAFLGLVVVLGFYAAIPLYIFCYMKLYAKKGSLVSAVIAFGVAVFLYLVFDVLMGYEIFRGIIAGDRM
jgi:hypothetical protein